MVALSTRSAARSWTLFLEERELLWQLTQQNQALPAEQLWLGSLGQCLPLPPGRLFSSQWVLHWDVCQIGVC